MVELPEEGFYAYSPIEVKELMENCEIQIIDVREKWEFDFCHLEGAIHIPLSLLPLRLNELDKNAVTVVVCHHGNRSYFAGKLLEREGVKTIINLSGGMNQWSLTVDRSVPTY